MSRREESLPPFQQADGGKAQRGQDEHIPPQFQRAGDKGRPRKEGKDDQTVNQIQRRAYDRVPPLSQQAEQLKKPPGRRAAGEQQEGLERLVLGEGEGRNWWCVVFPPLCTAASVRELDPETTGLTESEIEMITEASGEYEVRFKTLELLSSLFRRLGF